MRRFLDKPEIVRRVLDIAPHFAMDRRVIVLLAAKDALPAELQSLAAPYVFALPSATGAEGGGQGGAHRAAATRAAHPRRADLTPTSTPRIDRLRGMTAFEAERTLSQAIMRDNALTRDDVDVIVATKKAIAPGRVAWSTWRPREPGRGRRLRHAQSLAGQAPARLRAGRREVRDRAAAAGILPLGVQGCRQDAGGQGGGAQWRLPLLKMEPGRLYDKNTSASPTRTWNRERCTWPRPWRLAC